MENPASSTICSSSKDVDTKANTNQLPTNEAAKQSA